MKNMNNRKVKYNLSDLIDKISIDQIKQINFENKSQLYEKSISDLIDEIDQSLKNNKKKYKLDATIIRIVIALSQINLFIWFLRDELKTETINFNQQMKLSHQLNSLRNNLKNMLLNKLNEPSNSLGKTNIDKEDLKGWHYSILDE
tara:strand:- start:147 stop:584 length:438 start_codon:yes stop_codon:yes gene_type:complete